MLHTHSCRLIVNEFPNAHVTCNRTGFICNSCIHRKQTLPNKTNKNYFNAIILKANSNSDYKKNLICLLVLFGDSISAFPKQDNYNYQSFDKISDEGNTKNNSVKFSSNISKQKKIPFLFCFQYFQRKYLGFVCPFILSLLIKCILYFSYKILLKMTIIGIFFIKIISHKKI